MKVVAICGSGPSVTELPNPYIGDVWIMNGKYGCVPRWDLMFDLHHETFKSASNGFTPLEERGIPLDTYIVQENYPTQEALALRGFRFHSTTDLMIAYAILKGYEAIDIYGVDFRKWEPTRELQRRSVAQWIEFARELGILVYISPMSAVHRRDFDIDADLPTGLYPVIKYTNAELP